MVRRARLTVRMMAAEKVTEIALEVRRATLMVWITMVAEEVKVY